MKPDFGCVVGERFLHPDCIMKTTLVVASWNLARPEAAEMVRRELYVKQNQSAIAHPVDQMDESGFRCIGDAVKHRLSEKRAADRHPVQATD